MKVAVFGAGRMAEIRIEDLASDRRITGISVINRTVEKASSLNLCPSKSARSSTCVAIACEMSVQQRRAVKVAEVRGV